MGLSLASPGGIKAWCAGGRFLYLLNLRVNRESCAECDLMIGDEPNKDKDSILRDFLKMPQDYLPVIIH